jgi:uncharacterized protein (DUF305 family)
MKKSWFLLGLSALLLTISAIPLLLAEGPIEGRAGRAEVRFLEGMIDHHQMALDMANDCLAKASTESVVTLCQNIVDAQSAEITTMQGWLLSWYNVDYKPMSMTHMSEMMGNGMEGMDHSGMEGMPATDPPMMMGMMAGLNRLEGGEYEIAFLESMIDHHDDAVHMSTRVLERSPEGTGHTELRELAQKIIDDQTAEIEAMENLLVELGG